MDNLELDEKREELSAALSFLKQAMEALPAAYEDSVDDVQWVIDNISDKLSEIDEKANCLSEMRDDIYIDSFDTGRIA